MQKTLKLKADKITPIQAAQNKVLAKYPNASGFTSYTYGDKPKAKVECFVATLKDDGDKSNNNDFIPISKRCRTLKAAWLDAAKNI